MLAEFHGCCIVGGMDTAFTLEGLANIKLQAASIKPLDPVLVEMLPQESAQFYKDAPETICRLTDAIKTTSEEFSKARAQVFSQADTIKKLNAEIQLLNDTAKRYAIESGQGELFMQNFKLVKGQIQAGRK